MLGLNNFEFFFLLATIIFSSLFIIETIFFIYLAKKTHMIEEFKAMRKGKIMAWFIHNNKITFEPVDDDVGVVFSERFGTFIKNDDGIYIDEKTKNIITIFDASVGVNTGIKAYKIAMILRNILKDDPFKLKLIREKIYNGQITNKALNFIRESIDFTALKPLLTAILPHSTTMKIDKTIAKEARKLYNNNANKQIIIYMAATLGVLFLGYLIIRVAAR